MNSGISNVVIVGSSRGLGAALVQEFLDRTSCGVHGVSRTPLEQLPNGPRWTATGRYAHLAIDIGAGTAAERMAAVADRFRGRLCVIYNAADVEKDLTPGGTINGAAFERVNTVGVIGLGNVLLAFQERLMKHGGMFVGITSHWGSVAPLFLPYAAYPASKAYLNMVLRCLRAAWRGRVEVVQVTIGNIKDPGAVDLPRWFIPTYAMGAQRIVSGLLRKSPPRNIQYPRWHALVYRYVLRFIPESVLGWIFTLYLKIESARKGSDAKQDTNDR